MDAMLIVTIGTLVLVVLALAATAVILNNQLKEAQRQGARSLAYAERMAKWMHKNFYPDGSPQWEVCIDMQGVLSQIDNMLTGLRRDCSDWTPSGIEYDRSIHSNPDAKAWADLFVATFPGQAAKHELMVGWFANAMMAMHDSIKQGTFK